MTTWLPLIWVAVGHMGQISHRRRTDVAWTLLNEFPCHGVVIQRDNSMTVRTLTVFINEVLFNRPLWPADTQTCSLQKSSWENIVINLLYWWVTFKDVCLCPQTIFIQKHTYVKKTCFKISMKLHLECISPAYYAVFQSEKDYIEYNTIYFSKFAYLN